MAFTDRHGGVSGGSFASLNLAVSGDDDPEAVRENHLRLAAALRHPGPLSSARQVHGAEVVHVGGPGGVAEVAESLPVGDALVSGSPGVALMVRAADCVPVLLADPDRGVVGAAHAGRQGLLAGVVTATVAAMRRLGATRLTAWVGPHICAGCYEVPEAMRESVAAVVPSSRAVTRWGTPSLDLGAGVRAQLAAAGAEVVDAARCTLESADLYSYRRDGRGAGRFAGVVRLAP